MEDFNVDALLNEEQGIDEVSGSVEKKPITAGKIISCIAVGVISSFLIFLLVGSLYTEYIRFPNQEEIIYESTGMYALNSYEDKVHKQEGITDSDYLLKEIEYANSDADKLSFIKSVVSTVDYSSDVVNAKNIFGNDMVNRDTLGIATMDSPVVEGEEVNLTYIDYSSIQFNQVDMESLVSRYELSKDNVNYANVLVSMFCEYISTLDNIPLKTERHLPFLTKTGDSYVVLADEDEFLDKKLFSSKEFYDCQTRFSEAVGLVVTGEDLVPTEEWEEWNKLSSAKKEATSEPYKYGKLSMSRNWCGAYYLQNEYYTYDGSGNKTHKPVSPQLGGGTLESPASINTSVLTWDLQTDEKGVVTKVPIRVELLEFGSSEDAISWLQSKHVQNRGYILDSEVQYCYYIFKVTNLSGSKITIDDNTSLCDKNGNLSSRTGNVFGLQESVTLNPDESGIIESWGRSTELHKKYVIWGADFNKNLNPVWFRVLAGDLEDKSENKGVYLITRSDKDKESKEETTVASD